MPVNNLFSYRQLIGTGNLPDIWQYDFLSEKLRNQIVYILRDALGTREYTFGWEEIHDIVAREHGVRALALGQSPRHRCEKYLRQHAAVDEVLDFIEAAFSHGLRVVSYIGTQYARHRGIKLGASDAIAELNERFRRAGAGYRFEAGQIIRIDSELVHSEVVRPALQFLQQAGFEGPRDEFLKAYAHYRASEMKDAIVNANNAFESTLKAICDQRKWKYQNGARASDLLKTVRDNGLFPDYLDKSFDQLAATLKSGLPKVRGEEGGHGQGARRKNTPHYVAAYALHLAAAKILFLAYAHREKH